MIESYPIQTPKKTKNILRPLTPHEMNIRQKKDRQESKELIKTLINSDMRQTKFLSSSNSIKSKEITQIITQESQHGQGKDFQRNYQYEQNREIENQLLFGSPTPKSTSVTKRSIPSPPMTPTSMRSESELSISYLDESQCEMNATVMTNATNGELSVHPLNTSTSLFSPHQSPSSSHHVSRNSHMNPSMSSSQSNFSSHPHHYISPPSPSSPNVSPSTPSQFGDKSVFKSSTPSYPEDKYSLRSLPPESSSPSPFSVPSAKKLIATTKTKHFDSSSNQINEFQEYILSLERELIEIRTSEEHEREKGIKLSKKLSEIENVRSIESHERGEEIADRDAWMSRALIAEKMIKETRHEYHQKLSEIIQDNEKKMDELKIIAREEIREEIRHELREERRKKEKEIDGEVQQLEEVIIQLREKEREMSKEFSKELDSERAERKELLCLYERERIEREVEKEDMRTMLNQVRNENEKNLNKVEELEFVVTKKQRENEKLSQELKELMEREHELATERENRMEMLRSENKIYKDMNEMIEKESSEKLELLEKEKEEFRFVIERLRDSLQDQERNHGKAQNELQEQRHNLEVKYLEITEQNRLNSERIKEIQYEKDVNDREYIERVEELKKVMELIEEKRILIQQERNDLEILSDKLRAEMEKQDKALKHERELFRHKEEEMKFKLVKIEREKDIIEAEALESRRMALGLKTVAQNQNENIEKLHTQLQQSELHLRETHQKLLTQQKEIRGLKNLVQSLKRHFESTIFSLKEDLKRMKHDLLLISKETGKNSAGSAEKIIESVTRRLKLQMIQMVPVPPTPMKISPPNANQELLSSPNSDGTDEEEGSVSSAVEVNDKSFLKEWWKKYDHQLKEISSMKVEQDVLPIHRSEIPLQHIPGIFWDERDAVIDEKAKEIERLQNFLEDSQCRIGTLTSDKENMRRDHQSERERWLRMVEDRDEEIAKRDAVLEEKDRELRGLLEEKSTIRELTRKNHELLRTIQLSEQLVSSQDRILREPQPESLSNYYESQMIELRSQLKSSERELLERNAYYERKYQEMETKMKSLESELVDTLKSLNRMELKNSKILQQNQQMNKEKEQILSNSHTSRQSGLQSPNLPRLECDSLGEGSQEKELIDILTQQLDSIVTESQARDQEWQSRYSECQTTVNEWRSKANTAMNQMIFIEKQSLENIQTRQQLEKDLKNSLETIDRKEEEIFQLQKVVDYLATEAKKSTQAAGVQRCPSCHEYLFPIDPNDSNEELFSKLSVVRELEMLKQEENDEDRSLHHSITEDMISGLLTWSQENHQSTLNSNDFATVLDQLQTSQQQLENLRDQLFHTETRNEMLTLELNELRGKGLRFADEPKPIPKKKSPLTHILTFFVKILLRLWRKKNPRGPSNPLLRSTPTHPSSLSPQRLISALLSSHSSDIPGPSRSIEWLSSVSPPVIPIPPPNSHHSQRSARSNIDSKNSASIFSLTETDEILQSLTALTDRENHQMANLSSMNNEEQFPRTSIYQKFLQLNEPSRHSNSSFLSDNHSEDSNPSPLLGEDSIILGEGDDGDEEGGNESWYVSSTSGDDSYFQLIGAHRQSQRPGFE